MKTSKSFMCTTNETDMVFIKSLLDNFIKRRDLSFYAFVVHKCDDDIKAHTHIFIDPCKEIDPYIFLYMLHAHGFVNTDWIDWSKNLDLSEDILCINISSEFSHYLEV